MDRKESDCPVYEIDDLLAALRDAKSLGYKFCQLVEWFDEDDESRVLSVEALDGDDASNIDILACTDIDDVWEVKLNVNGG